MEVWEYKSLVISLGFERFDNLSVITCKKKNEKRGEGMIKLKGILKLTVWRPKASYMLTALVKDCLFTTFACISE